jgi:hypothetical protein
MNRRQLIAKGKHHLDAQRKEKRRKQNGKLEKFCRGPSSNGGHWVSVEKFYEGRRTGTLRPWCQDCDRKQGGHNPNYPVLRFMFAFDELVNRLGKMEAARRIGITQNNLRLVLTGKTSHIRHKTAVKILLALHNVRITDEVRHRDSIRHGAKQRGRPEKKVTAKVDLYRPHGDNDNELKKRSRVRQS